MGSPKVDKLLLKIIPSADAQVLALKAGELDMIELQPGPVVRELMAEPNIKVMTAPSTYIYYIDFNLRRYPMNLTEFRVAVAHAINKEQILNILLLGMGKVGDSVMVPGLPLWYNPNVTKYEYNPEKAKEILDRIGLRDIDGDGYREYPNGSKLVLKMPTINVGIWPRLSELVAKMLEEVGLKVEVIPAEAGTVIDLLLNKWDFDINVLGWRLYFDPDPYLYESFHSSRIRPGGLNWVGYSNPEVDELLEKQRKAINIEERRKIIFKIQEILARDLPWIPLVYPDLIYAVRIDTFRGWVAVPRYGLRNVYSWINLEEKTPLRAVAYFPWYKYPLISISLGLCFLIALTYSSGVHRIILPIFFLFSSSIMGIASSASVRFSYPSSRSIVFPVDEYGRSAFSSPLTLSSAISGYLDSLMAFL